MTSSMFLLEKCWLSANYVLGTILRVSYSVMHRKDNVSVVLYLDIWMKGIRISAINIEELSIIQRYCGQKVCAVSNIEKWSVYAREICDDVRKEKKLKNDKNWNKCIFSLWLLLGVKHSRMIKLDQWLIWEKKIGRKIFPLEKKNCLIMFLENEIRSLVKIPVEGIP